MFSEINSILSLAKIKHVFVFYHITKLKNILLLLSLSCKIFESNLLLFYIGNFDFINNNSYFHLYFNCKSIFLIKVEILKNVLKIIQNIKSKIKYET